MGSDVPEGPVQFSVWAPGRHRVELCTGDNRLDMDAQPGGWWLARVEAGHRPVDYGFCLDGGPPRPDPRSPWQPRGPEGLSRTVDHSCFEWSDQNWRGTYLPSAVVYECHVGTFSEGGTFDTAIERLDHLVALGVTAVEIMPVAEASGEHGWGYDGVDLYAPHHAYGGPDALKRLVDACHRRGLGVILDVVYNHLGPSGNHLGEFGPYFTSVHKTNWGDAVNFDGPESGEVRSYFVDNALMWLRDYHVDGLRLDAVHAIKDESACHFVESVVGAVHTLAAHVAKPLFVVVESDLNDPVFVRSRDAGGYGADAAWADEFHHALHAVLTGEVNGYYEDFGSLSQLAVALRRAWVYAGEYSPHRRRAHGRPPIGLPGERFVVCSQNHDQVGNRAKGDRLCASVSKGKAKIAAALTLLSPFVPMLFQGEEWAASTPFQYFTDHQDADLGRAVSEGRRREFTAFGWAAEEVPDPQGPATFARSRLDWSELDDPGHAEMLGWYRALIELRSRVPDLASGGLDPPEVHYDEERRWLTMRRGGVVVAVNLGARTLEVGVSAPGPGGRWQVLMASSEEVTETGGAGGETSIRLVADSVAVLSAWSPC